MRRSGTTRFVAIKLVAHSELIFRIFHLGTEDIYISDQNIMVAWVVVAVWEEVNREVYGGGGGGGCKLDFRLILASN